jgi:hypothetical protein
MPSASSQRTEGKSAIAARMPFRLAGSAASEKPVVGPPGGVSRVQSLERGFGK